MTAKTPASASFWSGFPSFNNLQRQINHLFDDFGNGLEPDGFMSPRIDIEENDKAITISAEVPGVDVKDVDVSVDGNILTVRGEKFEETKSGDAKRRLTERSYGSFYRSMTLPFAADGGKVTATAENGVLTITVPKPPEQQQAAHKIAITTKH